MTNWRPIPRDAPVIRVIPCDVEVISEQMDSFWVRDAVGGEERVARKVVRDE